MLNTFAHSGKLCLKTTFLHHMLSGKEPLRGQAFEFLSGLLFWLGFCILLYFTSHQSNANFKESSGTWLWEIGGM